MGFLSGYLFNGISEACWISGKPGQVMQHEHHKDHVWPDSLFSFGLHPYPVIRGVENSPGDEFGNEEKGKGQVKGKVHMLELVFFPG